VTVSQIVRVTFLPSRQLGSNTKFTVVADQAPLDHPSIDSPHKRWGCSALVAASDHPDLLFSVRSTIVDGDLDPGLGAHHLHRYAAARYTSNVITPAAYVAIGRVVDDSIVVIEKHQAAHRVWHEEKLPAILAGVRGVHSCDRLNDHHGGRWFPADRARRWTHGRAVPPLRLTVTMARFASLISLTIVPVLAYWFPGNRKVEHKHGGERCDRSQLSSVTRLQKVYLPVIR
jgi:HAE1 family hydrophobic/amphiphilic exporter-1